MSNSIDSGKLYLFEQAPIAKAVATLAVPTVISQLIMTVYNLADAFFVGKLNNPNQMAAITLALSVQLTLQSLANLFGMGGGAMISRLLGAKKYDQARRTSAFAFYGVMVVMVIYSLCTVVFHDPFLQMLGCTPAIYEHLSVYIFWVLTVGGFFSVFNMSMGHLIRAEGASKEASFGLSMGGVLNMILDPIFIFPLGLGLKGAAMATCLSNFITSLYYIRYLCRVRGKTTISLSPKYFTLERSIFLSVLAVGLPSALQTLLSSLSNTVLNNIVVGYGESAAAGVGICKKIDSIPAYTMLGVTQGVVPLIAYNHSSGNHKRMKDGIRFSLLITFGVAAVALAAYQIFPSFLSALFIKDTTTIRHAAVFLRIHSLALPFTAVSFLMTGIFQAMKLTKQATVLSLIRKGLFDIPLMFVLNRVVVLYGPMMCQPIMDCVSAVCAVIMYRSWQRRTVSPDDPGR